MPQALPSDDKLQCVRHIITPLFCQLLNYIDTITVVIILNMITILMIINLYQINIFMKMIIIARILASRDIKHKIGGSTIQVQHGPSG